MKKGRGREGGREGVRRINGQSVNKINFKVFTSSFA